VIGAMLVSFLQSALSSYTQAWLLYFGLFFVVMILFAPGGIASLIMLHLPAARSGLLPRLIPSYLISGAALAVVLGGFITLVEMTYHLEMGEELGKSFKLFGLIVDVTAVTPWLVAAVVFVAGLGVFAATVKVVRRSWDGINVELQTRGAS